MEALKIWFPIVAAIFAAGLTGGAYVNAWITTNARTAELSQIAARIDQRLDLLEQTQVVNVRRLDGFEAWQGQIGQLSESRDVRIRAVEGAIATFTSEISAVRALLAQIVERLDNPKDKA